MINVGFIFCIVDEIYFILVLDKICSDGLLMLRWFVFSFVCFIDFFFEMYSILFDEFDNWVEICSNNVDFLISGLLLIKMSEFLMMFLLSILLNLLSWVLIWGFFDVLIDVIGEGFCIVWIEWEKVVFWLVGVFFIIFFIIVF